MMRRLLVVGVLAGALLAGSTPARAEASVVHGTTNSFDGTPIVWTLFVPESASETAPAPVIFNTHGWGGSRTKTVGGIVGRLVDEGYAVLTWDARGFGDSGGEVNVDSQAFEVKDVRALIDMVSARPEIQKDAAGDPRMGMVGGSYAGGIQLMTAAADRRIDAIVPQIAWNDLVRSLKPNGVLKIGWGSLLYGAGTGTSVGDGVDAPGGPRAGALAPEIHQAYAEGLALNDWSPEIEAWFDARGPTHYLDGPGAMPGVRIPTLLIQGTIDTLFTPLEAVENARQIRANGAPVKTMYFCGGHTLDTGDACRVNPAKGPSQAQVIESAILRWFDRYVRNPLGDAQTGPAVELQLQDGTWRTAAVLPSPSARATLKATLANPVAPTSGNGSAATPAPDAARAPFDLRPGSIVAGIPRATVRVSGAGVEGALFIKLVDRAPDGSLRVVDDQATALKVEPITTTPTTYSFDLAGAFWKLESGHQLLLEVSTTSNDHNSARVPGVMSVQVTVSLPLLAGGAHARGRDPRDVRVLGGTLERDPLPRTGGTPAVPTALVLLSLAAVVASVVRVRAAGGRS